MAAAAHLFFLLEVLRTALMQPSQLLQECGALGCQCLASTDPALERCLRWEAATVVLTVVLQVGLDILDAIC